MKILFENKDIDIMVDDERVVVINYKTEKIKKHNHQMYGVDNETIISLLKETGASQEDIKEYEKSHMFDNVRELENN